MQVGRVMSVHWTCLFMHTKVRGSAKRHFTKCEHDRKHHSTPWTQRGHLSTTYTDGMCRGARRIGRGRPNALAQADLLAADDAQMLDLTQREMRLGEQARTFCRDVPLWQSISKSVALLCAGNQQYRTTWSWSRWSAVVLGRGRWIVHVMKTVVVPPCPRLSVFAGCLGVFFTDHTRFLSK